MMLLIMFVMISNPLHSMEASHPRLKNELYMLIASKMCPLAALIIGATPSKYHEHLAIAEHIRNGLEGDTLEARKAEEVRLINMEIWRKTKKLRQFYNNETVLKRVVLYLLSLRTDVPGSSISTPASSQSTVPSQNKKKSNEPYRKWANFINNFKRKIKAAILSVYYTVKGEIQHKKNRLRDSTQDSPNTSNTTDSDDDAGGDDDDDSRDSGETTAASPAALSLSSTTVITEEELPEEQISPSSMTSAITASTHSSTGSQITAGGATTTTNSNNSEAATERIVSSSDTRRPADVEIETVVQKRPRVGRVDFSPAVYDVGKNNFFKRMRTQCKGVTCFILQHL